MTFACESDFYQEKAVVGAFSVIVKTDGSFAALVVSRPSNVKGHTTQREENMGQ